MHTTHSSPWNINEARFSLFGAGINTPNGQRPAIQGTLHDVYSWMNSMRLYELTRQLRAIDDEKEQRAFKASRLPFATFSGQFSQRRSDGLISHSGLQCFDIDHLSGPADVRRVRQLLLDDPYFETELMFTSPRGNGVKWVTHVDLSRGSHAMWYAAIREHLRRAYAIDADPAPSNVASACFLCADPLLVINPAVAAF